MTETLHPKPLPSLRRRTFDIVNKRGLHARAAAKFTRVVGGHAADVRVTKDGITVSGQSIMGLMMLAASQGTAIAVEADGPDAAAVLAALEDLIGRRFEEDE